MQLELTLAPAPPANTEMQTLISYLYARGHAWTKSREIIANLGLTERQIRNIASNSQGRIVSGPGCPGYKDIRNCDPEEIKTVTARLRNQAKLMADRAGDITRAFHTA